MHRLARTSGFGVRHEPVGHRSWVTRPVVWAAENPLAMFTVKHVPTQRDQRSCRLAAQVHSRSAVRCICPAVAATEQHDSNCPLTDALWDRGENILCFPGNPCIMIDTSLEVCRRSVLLSHLRFSRVPVVVNYRLPIAPHEVSHRRKVIHSNPLQQRTHTVEQSIEYTVTRQPPPRP